MKRKRLQGQAVRGFLLLDILFAVVVIAVGVAAATMVASGNQEFGRDAGLHQEALYKTDEGLEDTIANLKANWGGVASAFAAIDSIYTKSITVSDISECMKLVTTEADWSVPSRSQYTGLSTLVTSIEEAKKYGLNCNTTPPPDDWDFPQSYGHVDFQSSSGIHGMDIDVINRGGQRIGFLAGNHSSDAKEDFVILDLSVPNAPTAISGSEINIGDYLGGNANGRVNALVAAGNYVYAVAHSEQSHPSVQSLVVIDVTDINAPAVVATSSLSGVTDSYPEEGAIAYYNGHVYLGTWDTAGPEFHIFDVSNPLLPSEITTGGVPLEITRSLTDIVVVDDRAYLSTTGDDEELIVIDISTPLSVTNPITDGTVYNALGTDGVSASGRDGSAVYVLGNRAYLGREGSGNNDTDEHEFFILDVTDPLAISLLGSKDLDLKTTEKVSGISVSSPLAFIVSSDTNAEFQVWNIFDPANIIAPSSCSNLYNYPNEPTAIDFMDNYGFVSNDDNKAMRVIYDDPSCTP